ncbi:5-methyltetrahydropteroyltriglutamate--homocysteine S-methyltransferase [Actinomadura sp. NBRC 104412]|uniref:cobalamin-independent methionine synthase II family protein n=1 Tax=Actinomadura sp. NBRC 104412 TaxID=3032203 RepID=UPI00249FB994|nr:cobalamin-independent methionine synthase II family protein [Actinomadura sp. NBRC 104412]GLZ06103.1 5-methyltetrahydropteroyltriglutamate--homocysteine S-methyltransferase [Actinomadura sp. NBRC 104412]
MADSVTFRADHVGSLIRPRALLEARRRHDAGEIGAGELREVEDAAIADAVAAQRQAGIDVVTDGEFRRRDFRTGFADAVDGISMRTFDMPWHTEDGVTTLPSNQFIITERLRQRRRLAEGEAAYLRSLTSAPIKVTLIAPGFLVDRFWSDEETGRCYASREELAAEVAAITRTEIEALIAEGVRYVQLDNPGYAAFLGAHARENSGAQARQAAFKRMLDTDRAAVEGVRRPAGVTIGLHVCRGNQSSMWLAEGGYEPIAEQLFASIPVDRFLLEYDDDRSGGFEPLQFVPKGTMVVLGLVSSKTAELETPETLARRIERAAKVVDLDHLAISPQCGFASVAEGGNDLEPADQFAKLRLVADTARATWGHAD